MILEHRGSRPSIDPSAYIVLSELFGAHREDRECG
jgi:hypothetical protein